MIKSKGIFAVSFIAMMVVGGSYANIASQGYVDQQIDTRAPAGDYATKTELNAKQNASTAVEVAAAGTAVGDATHPVYVNASGVATKIDKVAAAAKADTATTATSATKATQDASGNVITTTYATKTELNAKADAEDIPTVNNATLTIQKNGAAVATFTANSATAATANITVPTKTSELSNDSGFITAAALPEEYTLPAATAAALGGVKSGGDITVAADGAVTVNSATTADSATKATQDASGRVIADTYATKAEIPDEITVDATLSADSTNPVQNKVVKAALDAKADSTELDNVLKNTATTTSDGSLATAGALVAQDGALAIGKLAAGAGALSVVVGGSASTAANANASVVVGNNAKALSGASSSVAVGLGAETKGTGAVSVGWGTGAVNNATAVGYDSEVTGPLGVAVGSTSKATGERSVAVGANSTAGGDYAVQLGAGQNTNAGTFNVGLGSGKNYKLLNNDGTIPAERMPYTVLKNIAGGHHSMAIGDTNITDDVLSATVVGEEATVSATGGAAYGAYATSSASGATALGMSANAGAESSVAVGNEAVAEGVDAVVIGSSSNGAGTGIVAIGAGANVTQDGSIAVGQGAVADSGPKGIAIGNGAKMNTQLAIAIGNEAQTLGQAAVAIGPASKGLGSMGVAIGAAANATAANAIQLGRGENSEAGTFKVGSYTMLDSSGKIPGERLQISVGDPEGTGGYADIWIE